MSLDDCHDWIDSEILRDRWFRRRWPQVNHVHLSTGRVHAYGAYDAAIQTGHLVLPEWAGRMTVAHEMAHVCTEAQSGWLTVAAHGPEWIGHYLALTGRYLGGLIRVTLEDNLRYCGVKF